MNRKKIHRNYNYLVYYWNVKFKRLSLRCSKYRCMAKVTLLVSTYNWPEALNLSLNSVLQQTQLPHEIVIADDGSREETKKVIDDFRKICPVPVIHCWQKDDGFRKTRIMNIAIATASGDYIVQIDGDIVIDKNFIADHIAQMRPHTFVRGSRACLKPEITSKILASGWCNVSLLSKHVINGFNAFRSKFLAFFLCRNSNDVRHVKGCNTAFWKEDFIAANGYNNDLSGWGHEDIELAARLYNNGTSLRIVKSFAIAFHLYHTFNSRHNEQNNLQMYEVVIRDGIKSCENGYNELLNTVDDDRKIWS